MSTVLLAGGTGFIGSRLVEILRGNNYTVRVLSRSPQQEGQFFWNPAAGILDDTALQDVDCVVNLAGAGIADRRWTKARRRNILESRIKSAQTFRNAFEHNGFRPQVYVSASAIGYYGNSGERWMTETDLPADNGFLAECSRQWEAAADEIAALGVRTVKLRFGMVLAKGGGALDELVKPLRFGVGAYFGDGRPWYSWIHRDDVCRMIIWAIENPQVEGVFNAAAPHPVRNKILLKAISKAMRQPAIFIPVPAFALRLVLGEMAAVVLDSNRVSSEKSIQKGFQFQYPEPESALSQIFE